MFSAGWGAGVKLRTVHELKRWPSATYPWR
jgi:hypothetical protein